ncbi:hypothetical protein GCM10027189_24100 [Rufibacter soli]
MLAPAHASGYAVAALRKVQGRGAYCCLVRFKAYIALRAEEGTEMLAGRAALAPKTS